MRKSNIYLLLSLSLVTGSILSCGGSVRANADNEVAKKVLVNAFELEEDSESTDNAEVTTGSAISTGVAVSVAATKSSIHKPKNIKLDLKLGVRYKVKKTLTVAERKEIAYEKAWKREKQHAKDSKGLSVPDGVANCDSSCRSWMSYTAVTATTSPQYKLLHSSEAHTHPKYGIRMVGDRFCAALGTGYANKIGTKFDVVMKNGSVVKCILGDQKSDRGTDSTHRFHQFYDGTSKPGDGSVLELIVDRSVFRGNVSQFPKELDGYIEKIVIIE